MPAAHSMRVQHNEGIVIWHGFHIKHCSLEWNTPIFIYIYMCVCVRACTVAVLGQLPMPRRNAKGMRITIALTQLTKKTII